MKSPTYTSSTLLASLAVMGLAACGGNDGGGGPLDEGRAGPGTVSATLVSPNGAEGAAWLRLIGPGLGAPEAIAGELFTSRLGDTTEVVVLLETAGEISFRFAVPDTTKLPTVELLQVADGSNALRTTLQGYQLRMVP